MPTAEELNKSGMERYKAGKYAEAVEAYEQAVAMKPDYAPGYLNLAMAYIKKNRPDDAVHAAEKSVSLAPQAGAAHHVLGNALSTKGRWNEAVSAYARAHEVDPKQILSLLNAGILLVDHGMSAKGVELIKRFLADAPADHPRRKEAEDQVKQAEGASSFIKKY